MKTYQNLMWLFLLCFISLSRCSFRDVLEISIPCFYDDTLKANTTIANLQNIREVLLADIQTADANLEESLFETGSMIDNMLIKYGQKQLETASMMEIASELVKLIEVMLDVINFLTCTADNPTDCTIDSTKSMQYVNVTEERMIQFMTILINGEDFQESGEVEINEGSIVIAAVKSKGTLLDEMVTKYSSTLDIPYVSPDATEYNNTELLLYVLTYSTNKYQYVDNERMINTGTTRTFIRDKDGDYIDLYSEEDQLQMVVDSSGIMNDPSFWNNITDVTSNNEFFLNASFHNDVDGALMNIRIKSIMTCAVKGYDANLNTSISSQQPVVDLLTEGGSNITVIKKPSNLKTHYSQQDLSLTFVPPENNLESMISLDMFFQCEACLQDAQVSFLIVKSDQILQDDFDIAINFVKKMINLMRNSGFSLHTFNETIFETVFPFGDGVSSGSAVNSYFGIIETTTNTPSTTYTTNTTDISNITSTVGTTTTTTTTIAPTTTTTTIAPTTTTTTTDTSQVVTVHIDSAILNLTSYLLADADWSKQQIAVIITDGAFGLNLTTMHTALWELRSRKVTVMAVGYGPATFSNVRLLVNSPASWYTFRLSRDPTEIIETEDLQDLLSKFCYGNYGDLAFNAVRFGRVSALMLNETSNRWQISENIKMKDISMATSTVTFKSNFLGTFGSNVFVVPPDVINFDTLFVDFAQKLEDSPYVLAVNVSCLVLMLLLMVFLKYFDRKDILMWDYLPLKNNLPRARYSYYMSFYTGFWSSSRLSSTPFVIIKGSKGMTGARAVNDGKRKMFERWTLGNFVLTTDRELGKLSEIKVWHDERGDSPSWYLEKVLIYDQSNAEKYTFLCGKWLAPDRDDCQTKRNLYAAETELKDGHVLFGSNARFNLFDDYLLLSLFSRPSASLFTRVQRCICVFSMLFLSMLANAMWYRTSEGVQTYGIQLGPFSLTYTNIYVGCMASLVTFIPGFVIASIFRNRKVKVGKSLFEQNTKEVINEGSLPWWFIFVGYAIAIACMSSGATFTFFYSIEWGRDTTVEWLMSFTFGTVQGILFLDPLKVIFLTLMIAFLCKKYAQKDLEEMAPVLVEKDIPDDSDVHNVDSVNVDDDIVLEDKPSTTSFSKREKTRFYKLIQLDRKLLMSARALLLQAFYIALIAIICAHNSVWTSYLQNKALEKRLTPIYKINKTDDIWAWFRGRFSDAVYPKLFYNGDVRLDEARSYMNDDVSYRIGLARIRQIRVKGKCDIPPLLQNLISKCPPEYSADHMERANYCEGWKTFNPKKCNGSEWTFQNEDETDSLTIFSNHDVYGGGGYVKILDQSVKEVRNDLYAMQAYDWIDLYTRLIVVEFVVYNPDSKLFSLPTITIEMPQTGGYYLTVKIKTARLYPYIDTFDFLVLGFQLLFLIITFCRLLHFVYVTWQIGRRCFSQISQWLYLISIMTSLAAIVFYLVRIDRTIYTIEALFNSSGKFVTFDIIDVMDSAYKVCISVELFVAVLNLLRPLTFNYNIYLMRTSISLCAKDLMSFGICILVPMSGFSILCFVCVGPYQMDFRDIVSAFITLFRTLLAMVKIRDTFGENDIGISFGFSVFLFVMTILMVNFCISILNDTFSYVKNRKPMSSDIDAYDMELHNHFWRKINDALKIFQRKQTKTDDVVEDKAGVLGLSMTLDNQIFRIVSQVERAYRNEETFQKKYKSLMDDLPKKIPVLEYEETSFSFRFDDISEESDSDTYSNDYNLPLAYETILESEV